MWASGALHRAGDGTKSSGLLLEASAVLGEEARGAQVKGRLMFQPQETKNPRKEIHKRDHTPQGYVLGRKKPSHALGSRSAGEGGSCKPSGRTPEEVALPVS